MTAPFEIHDTSLRDAIGDFVTLHVTSRELEEVLPYLDAVGFASIDAFGGSTFLPTLTVLGEDPWERLRAIRRAVRHTPLQAVLRGRLAFGMRPAAPGTLRALLRRLRAEGVDRVKVVDPGLDRGGASEVVALAKEQGLHVTATVVLSWGDASDAADLLVRAAWDYGFAGADAIALQDPFGLLAPAGLAAVVEAYAARYPYPLRLHLHDMNLVALAALERGLLAGAAAADATVASLAWAYSPPQAESLAMALRGSPEDPGLDLERLEEASAWFDALKARKGFRYRAVYGVDHGVFRGELPSAVRRALQEELGLRGRRDLFDAAWAEVPGVWEALGRPPLLRPFVQAVCGQAAENAAAGAAFASLDSRAVAYLRGEYGPASPRAWPELAARAESSSLPAQEPLPDVEALDPAAFPSEEHRLTAALFPEAGTSLPPADHARSVPLPDLYAEAAPGPAGPPSVPRRLRLSLHGEDCEVSLEAMGPADAQSRILFLRIGAETATLRVDLPAPGAAPVYGIHHHGRRHQVEVVEVLEPGHRTLPVLLRDDGHLQEVLYSLPRPER